MAGNIAGKHKMYEMVRNHNRRDQQNPKACKSIWFWGYVLIEKETGNTNIYLIIQ